MSVEDEFLIVDANIMFLFKAIKSHRRKNVFIFEILGKNYPFRILYTFAKRYEKNVYIYLVEYCYQKFSSCMLIYQR